MSILRKSSMFDDKDFDIDMFDFHKTEQKKRCITYNLSGVDLYTLRSFIDCTSDDVVINIDLGRDKG